MLATEEFRDRTDLLSYLRETYARGRPPSLHCFPFFLNEQFDLEEAFNLSILRGLRSSLHRLSDDLYLLGVGVRTSYQVGYLTPLNGSWIFLSDGQTGTLKSTVDAFARNMFPVLKLAYLPWKSLLQTVGRLKAEYDSVVVTEGTIRTRGQTFRNWKKEPIEFSPEAMVDLARREDGKWTGISFRCIVDGKEIVSCRAYERGHLTLYSGSFPDFYSNIVLPYIADAHDVHGRLQGLERRDTDGEIVLHPFRFAFPSDLNRGEMEILKAGILKRYSAAVTHAGNPMLMIQLSDREDGSIYDLYAYGDKIEIVPQQKASSESLGELIAFISDTLPLGTPLTV